MANSNLGGEVAEEAIAINQVLGVWHMKVVLGNHVLHIVANAAAFLGAEQALFDRYCGCIWFRRLTGGSSTVGHVSIIIGIGWCHNG